MHTRSVMLCLSSGPRGLYDVFTCFSGAPRSHWEASFPFTRCQMVATGSFTIPFLLSLCSVQDGFCVTVLSVSALPFPALLQFIVECHGNTLLPQFLGMYRLTVDGVETYMVVTRNVFSHRLTVHRKYDLKVRVWRAVREPRAPFPGGWELSV